MPRAARRVPVSRDGLMSWSLAGSARRVSIGKSFGNSVRSPIRSAIRQRGGAARHGDKPTERQRQGNDAGIP